MVCSACGTENEGGRKFCGECGAPLALPCSSCGAGNTPGAKFCGDCGAALAAQPQVSASAPQPTAERRLVSVLFADLVGFTAASESRDAEETRDLLSRYFETCKRLISLYGGTVEKFIGDAVMAVWGTPTATEDDAERAVRAALDLVAAVSALGDEVGATELRARAGVLTGEAAVTIGAEGEGMVAGDLVNTASRIQSIASPGAVLVGESTRRATEQAIAYEDAGSHELKGKVGLVPLCRALRVVSGARGALKSQGLEAPFVGRDRELRRIKDLFHACADDGKAQLVSIVGIAGIGKSRLGWEFYKYFDGLPQITYWHRGRCLSYGEGVTYWALADMVRMRARISEDEEPASALPKLAAVVEEHVLDPDDRRFVEPRLAHLLALEDGSRYDRDDLFAAWRLFFERLSDVYPTVMVFEDMQWADASLLDFIEYLLEWSRNSPLFVVTLARPDFQERRPTWGAGSRNFTSLFLEPLPSAAMEALLTGLVPGLPEELRAQILERAEGIPLYAVETVRMLLDRGKLTQEGSVYQPTGPIDSLEVPETLHALIAARLDGLPADERNLLQDCAVLGKMFTKQGLTALSGLGAEELEPLLTSLVRKEVLSIQADPRSPERGQYGFLQDLLRRVAYETLARSERKARHLAAAAHLEQALSEQEVVEVVASHYLNAYEAAPDAADAPVIKAKAGAQLTRAGERAASLGANEEAKRYFGQAAKLTDDPIVRAGLHEQAGRMAFLGGDSDEGKRLLEQALTVFQAEDRRHPAARIAGLLAEVEFRGGRVQEGVDRLEAALAGVADEEPDADVAIATAQLGRFLTLSGRPDLAAPHLERALELAEALDLPEVFANTLSSKAIYLRGRERLREARILLEAALDLALDRDLLSTAARALNNLGVVSESGDRYGEALSIVDRALEFARRLGDRPWEETLLGGSLTALTLLGRWDEALARGAEVEKIPGAGASLGFMTILVEIHCARGNLAEARNLLESQPDFRQSDDIQSRSGYLHAEARLMRAEGRPDEALAAAESVLALRADLGLSFLSVKLALVEAIESAFELGDLAKVREFLGIIETLRPGELPPLLHAQGERFRARLAVAEGEAEAAEAGFSRAAAVFRELEMPFWLAVTLLEHGEWLVAQGRAEAAEPLLADAHEIFERLEATPWLERAGQAVSVPV